MRNAIVLPATEYRIENEILTINFTEPKVIFNFTNTDTGLILWDVLYKILDMKIYEIDHYLNERSNPRIPVPTKSYHISGTTSAFNLVNLVKAITVTTT